MLQDILWELGHAVLAVPLLMFMAYWKAMKIFQGLSFFPLALCCCQVFQIFIYMGPGLFERKIPMNNVNSASLSLGVRALFMLGSFTKRLPSTDGLLVVVLKKTVMVALQIEMQTCIPLGVRAWCP